MKNNKPLFFSDLRDFPQILYIMGLGRSGSTILEIILSSSPGVTGDGELTHIFRDCFRDCSCGQPAIDCPFWKPLFNFLVREKTDYNQLNLVMQSVDGHRNFFKVLFTARFILSKTYHRINEKIFKYIQSNGNSSWVIDSSKYASRAAALLNLFPNHTQVLWLTRSPAQILRSFQKKSIEQPPKSLLQTVFYDFYVTLCCGWVKRRHPDKVLGVEYETFALRPVDTLDRIEQWTGIDLCISRKMLKQQDPFPIGHIITGNRVRKAGRVVFQPELKPHALTNREKIAAWVMGFNRLLINKLLGTN